MTVSYPQLCTSVLTAEAYQRSKESRVPQPTAVTGNCWDMLEKILYKHLICMIKYCFPK